MAIQPQTFLNFVARNYSLIHDIYRRESGTNEAELFDLIRKYRSENDPLPDYTFNQLLDFKIVEALPDATAIYEITRPISVLFRFLLQEQRLTSTTVIQAYLDDLDTYYSDLENALEAGKHGRIERALSEIVDTMERVRQDSRANRQAIINEVMSVKGNRERKTVRERFDKILLIWEKYLEPLKDLIDVKKSMDSSLDNLESLLKYGSKKFSMDGVIFNDLSRATARLTRLRRDVMSDFHESMQEVEPLYLALKRDSILARGASIALEKVDKLGIKNLQVIDDLAIPSGWLQEGLFTNTRIEAYLHGVKGYKPIQAPSIPANDIEIAPQYVDLKNVLENLIKDLPVDDVLAWLFDLYGEYSLTDLLRFYGRLMNSSSCTVTFKNNEKQYIHQDLLIKAYPLTVREINE